MNAPDSSLQHRARMLYREAAQHIDPVTAGRLRAARRTALAAAAPASRMMRLLPTGAVAFTLLVLMAWSPLLNHPNMPLPESSAVAGPIADVDSELPLDAVNADPKLYQNLDFYGWLATDGSHQVNH